MYVLSPQTLHSGARMIRIATLMTTLVLASCANQTGPDTQPASAAAPTWKYDVLPPQTYTPPGWPQTLTATVYKPQRPELMPAVLVVHGGSWTRRSPEDMTRVSKALASRGFVVINVAYRFAPEHVFPAQVEDLRAALDWAVTHAERLQLDPSRIGAFGYSAGAHLVSLLGRPGEPGRLSLGSCKLRSPDQGGGCRRHAG